MTIGLRSVKSIIVTAIICIFFTGCATTGPTKFYALNSVENRREAGAGRDISVEVGPVEIPDYLDRPYLVTRSGRNELMISDFHKWAGSLKDDISRVLAEDLSAQLSTDNVFIYPWLQSPAADYRVRIKINHFEGIPGDRVELQAYWSLYGENGTSLLRQNSSSFYEETGGNTYAAIVSAMSRAIGKLSEEIAGAIISLSHP